jgi:outer membrane protein TolC
VPGTFPLKNAIWNNDFMFQERFARLASRTSHRMICGGRSGRAIVMSLRGKSDFRAAVRLLGAAMAFALSAPASAQSFPEVLRQVGAHPLVAGARYQTAAGTAEVAEAKAAMRPQIGVNANAGWQERSGVGGNGFAVLPEVSLSQYLFDGGRTQAEIRRRKVGVDLLSAQEQTTFADIALRLSQAWIEYDRANALVAIGSEQVAALSTLEKLVVDIAGFDRGRASDVVMVRSRLSQAVTGLRTREIQREEARARITEIAAKMINPAGSVPDLRKAMPQTVQECNALADSSPASKVAELRVEERSAAVAATRNWWMPRLAVEGARTTNYDTAGNVRILNGFAVRLRAASLPFDSGGGKARNASAQAALSAAQAQETYARSSLRDQVYRLWTVHDEKAARLPQLESLVGQADQAREIVFEQFRLGRRSILDVLAYDLERYNVRAQLANERFDILLAQYQLLGLTGRLEQAVAGSVLGREG